MVVVKLTEPLRLSNELWNHLAARGIISTNEGDNSNLVYYIQECLARDDSRVPITLDESTAVLQERKQVESVDGEPENTQGSPADAEQFDKERTAQSVQPTLSTAQIVNRLSTLYNSGGTK